MTNRTTASLLLAGLMAVAGFANAQSTSAAGTTSSPPKSGEASTSVKGQPNANPDAPTLSKSKSEIKSEKALKKADARTRREAAVMGQKGANAGSKAGTPAVAPHGTPAVQDGGTPK